MLFSCECFFLLCITGRQSGPAKTGRGCDTHGGRIRLVPVPGPQDPRTPSGRLKRET